MNDKKPATPEGSGLVDRMRWHYAPNAIRSVVALIFCWMLASAGHISLPIPGEGYTIPAEQLSPVNYEPLRELIELHDRWLYG